MANAVRKGLILAVLGLAAAMSAVGQDGGQPNGPAPASTKPVGTPTALGLLGGQPSVLSLSFSGGTVGEYVEALRAQSAVGANISLGPAVAEMPMPPIQLRDVVLSVAVRAVETVTDSQGAPMMLTRSIVGEGGEPLFVISARADGASGGGSPTLRSFSVATLLDSRRGVGMEPKTLLGAVESLLSMEDGAGESARVMLHKETSTLIMRARKDQLVAVEDLLVGLERDAIELRDSERPARALVTELEAELRAVREKREILHERMRLNEKNIAQTDHMIKQGVVPQGAQDANREQSRKLEEERIELELRESHLTNRLEDALAAVGGRTVVVLRVKPEALERTLDAAGAICGAMSPRMRVGKGDQPGELEFMGTPTQIEGVRGWLRAQALLAE